ncbi:MAG: hypothetical protein COB12_00570 [Flavobacterium sp.]|nr:MAG: hypothetical protein COB12_00570 [Flavobacterium sp.]
MNKFITFIFIAFCLNPLQAQRNYKFENFGNRSILLNGNVTGSVDDLGATYYNPARLALIKDPVFSLNAKMFQLNNLKIDNVLIEGKNLKDSKFEGLPSMIAGTFKLKFLEGHQFAYSIISRNRTKLSMGYNTGLIIDEIIDDFPDIDKYIGSVVFNNNLRENWVGISWAKSFSENFSVGASLFYSDYKFDGGSIQNFSTIDVDQQVALYSSSASFRQKSYGLFGKIAAAWVYSNINFGVNIDLPYIEIVSDGSFGYQEYLTGSPIVDDIFTFNNFEDIKATRKYPLGVSVGAGIPYKLHTFHLNISWNAPIKSYSKLEIPPLESETDDNLPIIYFNEALKSTFNFGVGYEIIVSKKINAFGSFSTDFSPYKESATVFDAINQSNENINFNTDYYHYGAGLNLSHKWANFILGAVYSSGNSKIINPLDNPIEPDINTSLDLETAKIKINRWRFLIGVEILFMEKTFKKYNIDPKIINP